LQFDKIRVLLQNMSEFEQNFEVALAQLGSAEQEIMSAEAERAELDNRLSGLKTNFDNGRNQLLTDVHEHFGQVDSPLRYLAAAARVKRPSAPQELPIAGLNRLETTIAARDYVPVAILGVGGHQHYSPSGYQAAFGIATQGLTVRRPSEEENDWPIATEGVVTELPLRGLSVMHYESGTWSYEGPHRNEETADKPIILPNVREIAEITDSRLAVDALFESTNLERFKDLPRSIFFGGAAVASVLRHLSQTGLELPAYSAGLALGMEPISVNPKVDVERLAQDLKREFSLRLPDVVRAKLANAIAKRAGEEPRMNSGVPVVVNQRVFEQSHISESALIASLVDGMQRAGSDCITSEYYVPSSSHEQEEYENQRRLRGPEARQLVADFALTHFDVPVDPKVLFPSDYYLDS
jgi:hypothetical protein